MKAAAKVRPKAKAKEIPDELNIAKRGSNCKVDHETSAKKTKTERSRLDEAISKAMRVKADYCTVTATANKVISAIQSGGPTLHFAHNPDNLGSLKKKEADLQSGIHQDARVILLKTAKELQ